MDAKQKKCKHVFVHGVGIANNMRGDKCLWLFHECRKCKTQSNGNLIEILKKKVVRKKKKTLWEKLLKCVFIMECHL